jgi:uncharacterized membrane protein YgcG
MKATRLAVTCACGAVAICALRGVEAQGTEKRDNNLDLTMTLLPEHAKGPEEITRRIELPPPRNATEQKDAHGPNGDSKKDDKGPPADPGQQGRSTADQAREQGREFGQAAADQARENRENAGHGPADGNGGGNSNSGNGGGNSNGGSNGGGKGPPTSPPGHP